MFPSEFRIDFEVGKNMLELMKILSSSMTSLLKSLIVSLNPIDMSGIDLLKIAMRRAWVSCIAHRYEIQIGRLQGFHPATLKHTFVTYIMAN